MQKIIKDIQLQFKEEKENNDYYKQEALLIKVLR